VLEEQGVESALIRKELTESSMASLGGV
jgi:hypothetical protein